MPPILTLGDAPGIGLAQSSPGRHGQLSRPGCAGGGQGNPVWLFPDRHLYATAVGADSGDTRILAGGLNNPSVFDRAAGGVAISQLITDFGHTANLTASSKFQAQAASQNVNATREQVLLQVDTGYFGALQAQAVLHVAQQTLDTRQLLVDQVTALATNKLRSELDVSFAQVELEQARLLLQKSQSDAAAAMATLSTALGYREYHQFQLVEQPLPANAATNDVFPIDSNRPRRTPGVAESAQRARRRVAVCQIAKGLAAANDCGGGCGG